MPKDRYRLYHVEKAKGGIALTMTAGSAVVSPDSPPAFGNLLAYKDEIVPWLRRLADDCHEHGAAVMIQLTHLGRRTGWNKADWLPVLAPSPVREPAHRAFPKEIEDWDIERIVADYADGGRSACRRPASMASSSRPTAICWTSSGRRPPTERDDDYGGSLDNRLRFTIACSTRCARRSAPTSSSASAWSPTRTGTTACRSAEGIEIARRLVASGQVDFLNIIRGHIETDAALRRRDPDPGHARRAASRLRRRGAGGDEVPGLPRRAHPRRRDRAPCDRRGKLDMVGMTRAHIADPHIVRKMMEGREHEIRPCVGATYCLDRIYEGDDALCIHNAATGREATMPHVIAQSRRPAAKGRGGRRRPGRAGGGARRRRARPRGHRVRGGRASPAARSGSPPGTAPQGADRHRRLADGRLRAASASTLRFNIYAEADDVLAQAPDVVIVATGGLPQHRRARGRRRSRRLELGHSVRRRASRRERVLLYRRQWRPSRHAGGRAAGRGRERGGDRLARALLRAGDGRPEPRAYAQVLPSTRACGSRSTRGSMSVRREGNQLVATLGSDSRRRALRARVSTRSSSSTARCRSTISILRCSRCRAIAARSTTSALIAGRPQTVVRNPRRRVPALPHRRRRREPQHPCRDLRRVTTCP